MEEIEERIIVLRKELNHIKEECEILYKNYKDKQNEADQAHVFFSDKTKLYYSLDLQLAELDGRLKVIKAGKSGKVKKMTMPNLTQSQAKNLLGKLKGMMKK